MSGGRQTPGVWCCLWPVLAAAKEAKRLTFIAIPSRLLDANRDRIVEVANAVLTEQAMEVRSKGQTFFFEQRHPVLRLFLSRPRSLAPSP